MTLTELIEIVGEENIAVQSLDNTAVDFSRGDDYNKVSFLTEEDWKFSNKPSPLLKFGIVLWIDREKVPTVEE